jgi:hypothetical protein
MSDDTLGHVKDLQAAGFTREQAEAIVSLRYRNPSMLLAGLQETDLTRRQAEAILDYMWAQKISLIPRSPKLAGFVLGALAAFALIGFYFAVEIVPFAARLHH